MAIDIERQGRGFQTGRVATISIVHAVHDTYTGFLPPLLPLFIQRLFLSKAEAGLLTIFIQAPSLLQPFIGHLADRLSLRFLVILAPAVSAIAMSLLGVAPVYGLLAILLTVAGLSSASIHSVGPVMAGRLSGTNLGRGMGFWMVGGELGRVLGPLVIVTALEVLTPGQIPWLMAGGIVASAILYVRMRDVPARPSEAGLPLPWSAALRAMRPLLAPLVAVIITRAFVLAAITTYLPTFLNEGGSGLWISGAALSVVEAAGVLGALAGGSLSDRLGRRWVLAASLLSTPFFVLAFLYARGIWQLPFLVLMGFSSLAVTPVLMALVQESYPDNRALANGLYMAISFSLQGLAVVVFGAFGDAFGLRAAFVAGALVSLAGVPAVRWLPGRPPRRE
ncbi:MAG: MFS transporter [Candidatus Eisenbacteria bacterium]